MVRVRYSCTARGLALESLAQLVLGIRARSLRAAPPNGRISPRRSGSPAARRRGPDESPQIERVADAAVDANALALVVQLPFVARRTGYAGIVAGWPAFARASQPSFC